MSSYTTKQGDMFDHIAFKIYGHRRYIKELMEANSKHIDVIVFSAGVELNIPGIAVDNSPATTAPPWRD